MNRERRSIHALATRCIRNGWIVILLSSAVPAGAGSAATARRINGADLYNQAIALFNKFPDRAKQAFNPGNVQPSDPEPVYKKIAPILELIRQGRKADYVDWGPGRAGYTNPTIASRCKSMEQLSAMELWDARSRFPSEPDAAVADIAALEAMARAGADSMPGLTTGLGIHQLELRMLAEHANQLAAASAADLAYIEDTGAIHKCFRTALNGEASFSKEMKEQYANPGTRGDSDIARLSRRNSIDPKEFESDMAWLGDFQAALATKLDEPEPQFQLWWAAQRAKMDTTPATRSAVPGMDLLVRLARGTNVLNLMLKAGLALDQHDQAAFEATLEPISGKPYLYRNTRSGFQLLSSLKDPAGNPLVMSFPFALSH